MTKPHLGHHTRAFVPRRRKVLGAMCYSGPRVNPKAASSRRTPRCLRHKHFQRRESERWAGI